MKGSPMTEALYGYLVDRFARPENEMLTRMAARAQRAGMPLIMVSEDQARFLRVFLQVQGATRAVDVGSLFGYSAAILAQGMGPKGRVVSLELSAKHAEVARKNVADEGLEKQVDVRVGPALESMKALKTKSVDFVLIDAEKTGYIDYFEESLRLVRPGGVIAADNTLAWGRVAEDPKKVAEEDVRAIQRFNDHVAASDRVLATLLPLGDGLLVAHVKD